MCITSIVENVNLEKASGKELICSETAFLSRTSNCKVYFGQFGKFRLKIDKSVFRLQRMILYLFFANSSAVALPIPLVAPVIRTVLFMLCVFF
jgi:hypothetical protein